MAKKTKQSKVFYSEDDQAGNPLKDFYNDLDQKVKKKGCSLPLLYLFMFLLLLAIIFALFYAKRNFKIGINYFSQPEVANNSDGIFGKVQDELLEKENGQETTISFTEEELSYFLGVDEADFPLKKASLSITKAGIVLSGRTRDSYLSIPVKVNFKPTIKDGKLAVEIDQMQGSFVTLPKNIKDGLNNSVDDVINKKISSVNNFVFKEVILREGSLDLLGVKKSI